MYIQKFDFNDIRKVDRVSLKEREVHIWLIKWKEALPLILLKWAVMSKNERKKVESFKFFEDRMRCATGKIISRIILSSYTKLEEHKLHITNQKYGKPYLENDNLGESIHYNVSHSEELVLLVFTKLPLIGVDIEKMKDIPEYIEISKQFFTYSEYQNIKKKAKKEFFYQYWTAKEAYVKALGEGLNKGLNTFEISGNYIFEQGKKLNNWEIIPIDFEENYFANIAVRSR
ncbi:MAG: 4'-phosphopantetheinyl transferase superfamily protein [Fusobacteriaceae bacterium]|nr:4'-phosphopantetheinyl transferase superfamily protein [Fusobacteriaceae bacterium]